jgi:hypothetical protein
MHSLDANGDSLVSAAEMKQWLFSSTPAPAFDKDKYNTIANKLRNALLHKSNGSRRKAKSTLADIFSNIGDGSGVLTAAQFRSFIQSQSDYLFHPDEAEEVADDDDDDDDGNGPDVDIAGLDYGDDDIDATNASETTATLAGGEGAGTVVSPFTPRVGTANTVASVQLDEEARAKQSYLYLNTLLSQIDLVHKGTIGAKEMLDFLWPSTGTSREIAITTRALRQVST